MKKIQKFQTQVYYRQRKFNLRAEDIVGGGVGVSLRKIVLPLQNMIAIVGVEVFHYFAERKLWINKLK